VRPDAPDIALPPLPADLAWVGVRPARIEALAAAGPVLVHFFDFAQLNSVRSLPYVRGWHERYADAGLVVLGMHSPRFTCTAAEPALAAAASRLELRYPVAMDSGFRAWRAYGCEGWPSLFLWGRGGALRWFHFGEGEYRATEEAIQELILESDPAARLPEPLPPLRPTDAPGALVVPPSEEVFPGGSVREPWEASEDRPELELDYGAGGAYATAEGNGLLEVALDGRDRGAIEIGGPALQELTAHERHEEHHVVIRPSSTVRVWSISFAAGVP
jgi:hypothetical protein